MEAITPQYLQPQKVIINKKSIHLNADRLEIVHIAGFKCIVGAGLYSSGTEVLFFEPETAFTIEQAQKLEIDRYLAERTDIRGNRVLVIREVKLRGIMSEGLILPVSSLKDIDENSVFKYQPPASKLKSENAEKELLEFSPYGSLENLRKCPNAIPNGAWVSITEKIHGTNSRVGFTTEPSSGKMILHAGSRTVNRKKPVEGETSLYWSPFDLYPQIQALFEDLREYGAKSATLYGEIYGGKIQSYSYSLAPGGIDYRAFTLKIEGHKATPQVFKLWTGIHKVPTAPEIFKGLQPYSYELIQSIADGPSLLTSSEFKDHGREGVVVQYGPDIYKYVCDTYLLGKGAKNACTDL